MPITYEVCKGRTGTATFSRQSNKALEKIKKTWSVNWLVKAIGATDPSEVDEIMVANAPGLPSITNSIYVDPENGQIFPYFSAKSKSVTRRADNAYWFDVEIQYNDDTGEEQSQSPPNDAQDIEPNLVWTSSERLETAWEDQKQEPCLQPTGTLYAAPCVRRIPVLVCTFTQFENVFNDTLMQHRLYSCNSNSWTPESITWGRHQAMITDISYEEVRVPIVGNITMPSHKVTYKIECVEYQIKSLEGDSGNASVKSVDVGHEQVRIRADSRYLQGGDKAKVKVALAGQHMGLTNIYLDPSGKPHAKDKQFGIPPHNIHRIQKEISFSFLR